MTGVSSSTGFDPARIIRDHQAGVWRYLRALGCEPPLAEDLTQDTFLAVLQRPFDDYHPASTAAYLRRVARNLLITYRRRNNEMATCANIDAIDADWNRLARDGDGEALLDALRECLETLTDRARGALEMRFRDQCTRMEIAKALSITEHGAKNLMQRAKKTLRDCVERKAK